EEPVAPLGQRRGGHPQFPTQRIERFAPQDAQHHFGLPARGPATTLSGRLGLRAGAVHGHLLAGASCPYQVSKKTVGQRRCDNLSSLFCTEYVLKFWAS